MVDRNNRRMFASEQVGRVVFAVPFDRMTGSDLIHAASRQNAFRELGFRSEATLLLAMALANKIARSLWEMLTNKEDHWELGSAAA